LFGKENLEMQVAFEDWDLPGVSYLGQTPDYTPIKEQKLEGKKCLCFMWV
jgi:hypothetical protein